MLSWQGEQHDLVCENICATLRMTSDLVPCFAAAFGKSFALWFVRTLTPTHLSC